MSLKVSSERALDVSWTMAGMTMVDLKGRVNWERRGLMILSNRVGEDQYAS